MDLAALAQVADDVPMQTRPVLAARLGVGLAESHVNRAADLFVEERVAAVGLDVVVAGNSKLAQITRARVGLENRLQEVLSLLGFGFDDFALHKRQPNARDLAAEMP